MSEEYTPEYFANKKEQAQIAQAIWNSIPENVEYYNLIIVLSEMIQTMLSQAFNDEVFHHKTV